MEDSVEHVYVLKFIARRKNSKDSDGVSGTFVVHGPRTYPVDWLIKDTKQKLANNGDIDLDSIQVLDVKYWSHTISSKPAKLITEEHSSLAL